MMPKSYIPSTFSERWLFQAGIPRENLSEKLACAQKRATRYPWPFGFFYPFAVFFIENLVPFLFLFRLKRAKNLSPSEWEKFLKKLKTHSFPLMRVLSIFVLAPLMEVLTEEPPLNAISHPLEKFLASNTPPVSPSLFDVLIIGSGAGGAPIARKLSEKGFKVAIIEKGSIVQPDRAPSIIEKHFIRQGMVASIEGGISLVLAGSTLGGTTSINSGTALAPLQTSLECWDQQLGTHFAEGELTPWIKMAEQQIGVHTPSRSLQSISGHLFEQGLQNLGRKGSYILPRNALQCQGSGRCCFGCPTGEKQSTDRAFLPQAISAGASLIQGTAKHIREKSNLVSVEIETSGRKLLLQGRHLVIATGALYTPGLLKRNRLGSNWRQAGHFLKIHPATKVLAYFPEIVHQGQGIPQGIGYRPPELPRVTLEGIHTPKSVIAPILAVSGERFKWWLDRTSSLASFGLMVQDQSIGKVFEIGNTPFIRYRLHQDNVSDIVAGIQLIGEAFFAAGAKQLLLPITGSLNNEPSSPQELRESLQSVRSTELMISGFHPQGTAGMGRIVDNTLRLFGSKHISVCDASVLPNSPGVNPQVTIIALSLRLAEWISNHLQSV